MVGVCSHVKKNLPTILYLQLSTKKFTILWRLVLYFLCNRNSVDGVFFKLTGVFAFYRHIA